LVYVCSKVAEDTSEFHQSIHFPLSKNTLKLPLSVLKKICRS